MLKISRLADYGLMIVSVLASEGEQMAAQDLGDKCGLTKATTTKVLKLLSQAGIVAASRGKTGGYYLAKESKDVSVLNVLEAVDGKFGLSECCFGRKCGQFNSCKLSKGLPKLSSEISAILANRNILDLVS